VKVYGDFEAVVERIVRDAEQKARDTIRIARKAAEREVERARRAGEEEFRRFEEDLRRTTEARRRRAVSRIEIEFKRKLLGEKEGIVREVLEAVRSRLHDMPRDDRYADLLAAYVREGVENLGAADVILYFNGRDAAFFEEHRERVLRGVPAGTAVRRAEKSLPVIGGVVLRSGDGRSFDNSFDARLERMKDRIRAGVAEALRM